MKRIVFILFICIAMMQSCVSYKSEVYRRDGHQNIQDKIEKNDLVQVALITNEIYEIKVIMIGEKELYVSTVKNSDSYDKIIPIEDIDYMRLGELDDLKTFGLISLIFIPIIILLATQIVFDPLRGFP